MFLPPSEMQNLVHANAKLTGNVEKVFSFMKS